MNYSLSRRLVTAAVILLAAFLGVSGVALDAMYEKRAMASLQTQLLGHVYTLLSSADEDDKGLMVLPEFVPDPRLNRPDSGLYASVTGNTQDYAWYSASALGQRQPPAQQVKPGDFNYQLKDTLLVLNFGVSWDDLAGVSWEYTISIASSLDAFEKDMQSFRKGLFQWLGGSAFLLLVVQVGVLRWGLMPLKQAAEDIKRIESGELESLQGRYPIELRGLTDNINSLIAHGIANQQRYRKSLGDLAHSLKTPLALMQVAVEKDDLDGLKQVLGEQLPHIDTLVQYHLQRASVMGKTSLAQAISLKPVVEKITRGLDKVYRDKQIKAELLIGEDVYFYGDPADLMELMGNLLDNAYKYGNQHVLVSAGSEPQLVIQVEDDGPGIAPENRQRLLLRGMRADQKQPGQGIGLDIVNEIVSLYNAKLIISESSLGGVVFRIEFNR